MLLFVTSETNQIVADWMATECDRRDVPYLRLYTERFLQDVLVTIQPADGRVRGSIQVREREVPIETITGIWHYLPEDVRPDPDLDAISARLVRQEARETLQGLYLALEDRRWINPAHAERAAQYRIYQLRLAARIGFTTPRTIVTNQPDKVLEFLQVCGGTMIYKPLNYLILVDTEGHPSHVAYATRITADTIEEHLNSICLSPCMFQELVPKRYDLTIYVIGAHVWATAIVSQAAGMADADRADYRRQGLWNRPHMPIRLPPAVEQMCLEMTHRMGLRMCNFDLLLTPEGDYVFLDANPSDLWAAIEDIVGFPLCSAIVDDLLGIDTLVGHPYLSQGSLLFAPSSYSRLAARDVAL